MIFKTNVVPTLFSSERAHRLVIKTECDLPGNKKELYLPLDRTIKIDQGIPTGADLVITENGSPTLIPGTSHGTIWFALVTNRAPTESPQARKLSFNYEKTTVPISPSLEDNVGFDFADSKIFYVKRSRGYMVSSIAFIAFIKRSRDVIAFNVGVGQTLEFSTKLQIEFRSSL